MKYLGIDAGYKHFGLAIADGPLATPLPSHKHTSLADSILYLANLIESHQIDTVVIGLPTGKVVQLVLSLQSHLSKLSNLAIILHPEDLSTKDAISKLREIGANRKKLKNEHSYAACLILEDYLESLS